MGALGLLALGAGAVYLCLHESSDPQQLGGAASVIYFHGPYRRGNYRTRHARPPHHAHHPAQHPRHPARG